MNFNLGGKEYNFIFVFVCMVYLDWKASVVVKVLTSEFIVGLKSSGTRMNAEEGTIVKLRLGIWYLPA